MSLGKVLIIYLIDGKIKKKKLLYQMSYFPESDSHNRSKIKVELDLFNYTKKSNLNEESGIYTSEFAKKSD